MKKTKQIEETITKEEVLSMTCDCCGKTEVGEHVEYASDINNFNISFGYGSKFDTDRWEFDVCDQCLEKWVAGFKHSIKKIESM
jgi:hypothetical protein